MSHSHAILVCLDRYGSQWQLPMKLAPEVRHCVVGWQTTPPLIDAGVPDDVARILVSALLKHALVTFPVRSGGGISFVHTCRADVALQAFHTEYFDWSQRGQVIFLSPVDAPSPRVSEAHLDLAQDGERFLTLTDFGITGIVLPGVDGDVAGIFTFAGKLLDELLAALRAACEDAGAGFRNVTEAELAGALAQT
jgi:hypothetical protein